MAHFVMPMLAEAALLFCWVTDVPFTKMNQLVVGIGLEDNVAPGMVNEI